MNKIMNFLFQDIISFINKMRYKPSKEDELIISNEDNFDIAVWWGREGI